MSVCLYPFLTRDCGVTSSASARHLGGDEFGSLSKQRNSLKKVLKVGPTAVMLNVILESDSVIAKDVKSWTRCTYVRRATLYI